MQINKKSAAARKFARAAAEQYKSGADGFFPSAPAILKGKIRKIQGGGPTVRRLVFFLCKYSLSSVIHCIV